MNVYEKLRMIQGKLVAPKSQRNNFGKYNYRNTEDILEALKPLLGAYDATVHISDEVVLIGDRYYIKATATVVDVESQDSHSVTAYAREAISKKGMDESQITGAASSYARKYALNGLFLIDDTKDADHGEVGNNPPQPKEKQSLTDCTDLIAYAVKENWDIDTTVKAAKEKYKVSTEMEIKIVAELEKDRG